MNANLEQRLVLELATKQPSLHDWSLHEVNEEGGKIGHPQIPWKGSLDFFVEELSFHDSLEIENKSGSHQSPPQVTARQVLYAKLHPRKRWSEQYTPRFSMFGTDRAISKFSLEIMKLEEDQRCEARGLVSHTTEDSTSDDELHFNLYVQTDIYNRYVASIALGHTDGALLSIAHVDGIYSEWSWDLSPRNIKVLTQKDTVHTVDMPEACDIRPPRLGEIGSSKFVLERKLTFSHKLVPNSQTYDVTASDTSNSSLSERDKRLFGLLSSIQSAAWLLAILVIITIWYR